VVSVKTPFQRIDIYNIITLKNKKQRLESYKEWLLSPTSQEARDQPLFHPDHKIMLDGWIQSMLYNEASYHEALVHPAMFSHANPKWVAIVGGGKGARMLQDILKHNTVKGASMIDIDEMMMNVSRECLPEWSDCSDFVGSVPWCVNNARASIYYEAALAWFVDQYSYGN
jgi:Spermine/spermidine synthase domain